MSERKIHWQPWIDSPQEFALSVQDIRELLYGGSRGGGKTDAGIVWMVEPDYVRNERYRGLVIRRNVDDLSDWIARAKIMYRPLGANFAGKPVIITFPSGAFIRTGHLKDSEAYSKYQGHEYQKVLVEELTQIPLEKQFDMLLSSCRTTIPNLDAKFFGTTNPGGPGHSWVKRRWGIGSEGKKPCVAYRIPVDGRLRMYIPATVDDNPALLEHDPQYVKYLESLPEPLRSAWRYGDWDIFFGQMFAFDPKVGGPHVIDPIPVPASAPLYMTFDHGFGAPYSVGWWWVDADGRVYRFTELYGSINGQPDQGIRQTDDVIADKIIAVEHAEGIVGRDVIRLCDPTCFNKKPNYLGGGQGPSTAEVFAQKGLVMSPGDPSRILKIRQFHSRLNVPRDDQGIQIDRPMMQIYSTCSAFIETIPLLQADEKKVEDVDTTGIDHVYDESCHVVMARPMGTTAPQVEQYAV